MVRYTLRGCKRGNIHQMPQLAHFWPGGGTDPATMFNGPLKVERGWPHEIGTHLEAIRSDQPARVIIGNPWGTRDPARMEFDSYPFARSRDKLHRVASNPELVASILTAHHLSPDTIWTFYYGSPEHSEIFERAWSVENLTGIDQRVDACLRPVLELRDRGVKVSTFIDASAVRDKDSLTAHVHNRMTIVHGLEVGAEARLQRVSEWLNRLDTPVIAWRNSWYDQANWPDTIPAGKLLGAQWLICRTVEEARATMDEGLNAALIGRFTTAAAGNSSGTASFPPEPSPPSTPLA